MDKILKLSNRLAAVASFVQNCTGVIDVGTDHGYIPVYLAQNTDIKNIAAADIRQGPLKAAMRSARAYGVEDRIDFVLTDGLSGMENRTADTIIITGMGGETISEILKNAPWVKARNISLILQPQSKIDDLNIWLYLNGYIINDALLANENNKVYLILHASAEKSQVQLSGAETMAEKLLFEKRDPLLPAYLEKKINKLRRAVTGIEKSKNTNRSDENIHFKDLLAVLEQMKKEAEKWLM